MQKFQAFIPSSNNQPEDSNPVYQNRPVLRASKIRSMLEFHCLPVQETEVPDTADLFLTLTSIGIASPKYLDFLRYAYQSAKIHEHPDWFQNDRLIPAHFMRRKPNPAVLQHIPIYKLSGVYGLDTMSPIGPETWQNTMASAQNTYQAMASIRDGHSSVAYALNTSPGHHATYDTYAGYCFLNNAAFAARCLQHHEAKTSNVAILDLDYHAGDGTSDLLAKDEILTVSIHVNPTEEYPDFTGFPEEDDKFNYNFPVHGGATWSDYQKVLKQALDTIRDHRTEYLIIAFGADTYKDDPDPHPNSRLQLDIIDYLEMGKMIKAELKELSPKILVTQEGGYNLDAVPTIVANFILGLIGTYPVVPNDVKN